MPDAQMPLPHARCPWCPSVKLTPSRKNLRSQFHRATWLRLHENNESPNDEHVNEMASMVTRGKTFSSFFLESKLWAAKRNDAILDSPSYDPTGGQLRKRERDIFILVSFILSPVISYLLDMSHPFHSLSWRWC